MVKQKKDRNKKLRRMDEYCVLTLHSGSKKMSVNMCSMLGVCPISW